jgi:hypothetical protein
MAEIVRCPYCVERDNFKVMTVQEGHWFRCDRCRHSELPDYPVLGEE